MEHCSRRRYGIMYFFTCQITLNVKMHIERTLNSYRATAYLGASCIVGFPNERLFEQNIFPKSVRSWHFWESCISRNQNAKTNFQVGIEKNLVDHVWGVDQPERPENPIVPLELEFAGIPWESKVVQMREQMAKKKADVLILSALDEIAWYLPLRL